MAPLRRELRDVQATNFMVVILSEAKDLRS
jgi:hypothetical protein